jgi:hypothetical protein
MKNVQILCELAVRIKDVPDVCPYSVGDILGSEGPCCLFGNAVKFGLIDRDIARRLAFPEDGNDTWRQFFGVPCGRPEHKLVFIDAEKRSTPPRWTGLRYYKAIENYLRHYKCLQFLRRYENELAAA